MSSNRGPSIMLSDVEPVSLRAADRGNFDFCSAVAGPSPRSSSSCKKAATIGSAIQLRVGFFRTKVSKREHEANLLDEGINFCPARGRSAHCVHWQSECLNAVRGRIRVSISPRLSHRPTASQGSPSDRLGIRPCAILDKIGIAVIRGPIFASAVGRWPVCKRSVQSGL